MPKPTMNRYPPPLDRLLTLGEDATRAAEWPDYLELGLGPEHAQPLIRMATDPRLHDADDPESWAAVHAWRALGQLRAVEAAEPLVTLFHVLGEWEGVYEELQRVFVMLGPGTVPVLVRYLDQHEHGPYPRAGVAEALRSIAIANPDSRDTIVAAIAEQLSRFATQDRTLNGLLVGNLLDLDAVTEAPLMERAFAAGRVDIGVAGDWEDVQVELGLLTERRTPRPRYVDDSGLDADGGFPDDPFPETSATSPPSPAHRRERQRTEKQRRKTAKKSKRRNRRK